MAIVPTTFPDHYVLIAEFTGVAGTRPWRSELHIEGAVGTIPDPNSNIIQGAYQYWQDNLRTDATVQSLQLRHWTYGQQPFNAQSLPIWVRSINTGGNKTVAYGGEGPNPAGRELCGFVKIFNTGGRPGKQFLRYYLDEVDVTAVSGGEWALDASPPAHVTTAAYHVIVSNRLGPFNASAPAPRFCVVHFSSKRWNANPNSTNAPFSSPMTDMQLIGPTVNKSTRKNKK